MDLADKILLQLLQISIEKKGVEQKGLLNLKVRREILLSSKNKCFANADVCELGI